MGMNDFNFGINFIIENCAKPNPQYFAEVCIDVHFCDRGIGLDGKLKSELHVTSRCGCYRLAKASAVDRDAEGSIESGQVDS